MSHNNKTRRQVSFSGLWPHGYLSEAEYNKRDPKGKHPELRGMALAPPVSSVRRWLDKKVKRFVGKMFFMTCTFKPLYHTDGMIGLYKKSVVDLCKNMKKISFHWQAFPELTKVGVLHWHVLFFTTNFVTLKHFRGWWFRKYGRTDLESLPPTSHDYWRTYHYIRKDSKAMLKEFRVRKWAKIPLYFPSHTSYHSILNAFNPKIKKYKEVHKHLDIINLITTAKS